MKLSSLNCPNCGASHNPAKTKCEFCGSFLILTKNKEETDQDIVLPNELESEDTDNVADNEISEPEKNTEDANDSADTEASEADADTDAVSAFSYGDDEDEDDGEEDKKKPTKAGMVKKQIIMISVFAAVALILTLVYFIVLRPIFNERTKEEVEEPVPLIEGEVRDSEGIAILMFPHVEKANTSKVTVSNKAGGYTLVRDGTEEDGTPNFVISEHPVSPIEAETVTQIIVSAGYSVVMKRLEDSCPDEELYKYGLSESDNYTTVTVEDLSGNKYTYYVGSIIPSAGGYYCRYSTRSAIYIINSEAATTLNQSAESLLSPMLGYPLGSDAATMIDLFGITKNGESFITFSYDAVESEKATQKSIYKMTYPGDYIINSDTVASTVTSTLTSLEGAMVIYAGDGTAEGLLYKNEKLMAEYGFHDLEKPAYELYYEYGDFASLVIFTESGIDGYYYAYSYIWDTIVLVAETSVPYLKWGLIDFIMSNVFHDEIGDVDYISVSGVAYNRYEINEKFYYWKDEDNTLYSRAESTGWQYNGNFSERNYAQSFFLSVIVIDIQGYASDINFDKSKATEYARMEIKLKDGTVNTYVFYRQGGGGSCYYEVNGEGEFHVLKRQVDKMLVDAVRAANNCAVDWEAEYAEYPSENEMLNKS